MEKRKLKLLGSALLAFFAFWAAHTGVTRADEGKPQVIRIAYPGVGIGNRPFVGGNTAAVMHLQGALEEEFKKDGIQVTWTFLRGAGPATNELYANGLADFSLLGDLPSMIGKSGGLKTKILAATAIRGNLYLAVPASSSISSIKDIKGKRIAIFKGTNLQLAAAKILEANGLTEKDVKFLNMDTASTRAALVTGDIDGAFGMSDFLGLRDQGAVKIVYKTDNDPRFLRHCSFIGEESFIQKYPAITQRVVNTLVKAAKWVSDQEANRSVAFNLWTKSGIRFADFREDLDGQSLKVLSSPLLDPYFVSQYKKQAASAKKFGLIRNDIAIDQWIDPRFLAQALKTLGLEGYWTAVPEDGKVVASAPASSAPAASTAQVTASR